jgi:hypothetical protein
MVSLEDSEHARSMLASLETTLDSLSVPLSPVSARDKKLSGIDFLFRDLSFDSTEDFGLGPVVAGRFQDHMSSSPPILI